MSVIRMHATEGGYGVYATGVPGMAAAQAPQRKPAAMKNTEALDRLQSEI
jgi:hypothetical protein